MSYKSIANEAEGAIDSKTMRAREITVLGKSNLFVKLKIIFIHFAVKIQISCHCFDFKSGHFLLLVGNNL